MGEGQSWGEWKKHTWLRLSSSTCSAAPDFTRRLRAAACHYK